MFKLRTRSFLLGILSGPAPGLHVNNFAPILPAISPMLIDLGLAPRHIALIQHLAGSLLNLKHF